MRTLALCAALALCAGCNTVSFQFSKPDGTSVKVWSARAVWNTDSYEATLTTNGASLKATKSGVDAAAIGAATEGAVRGALLSVKGGVP